GLKSNLLTRLPLIGGGIDLAGSFVGKLRGLVQDLRGLLETASQISDQLKQDIQLKIYNALGPPGANILNDANGQGLTSADQVEVNLPDPKKALKDQEFSITLHLAGRDVLTADFNVGLDALAFEFNTKGGVELSWDYNLDFGIGVNLLSGFFFQLNQ